MKIRPHHCLCIRMFDGKGYDERFTAHMTGIVESLTDDTKINVWKGCDEICSQCPNRKQNVCSEYEKVRKLDEAVLKACEFDYGDETTWGKIVSSVNDNIFKISGFEEICRECQWYDLCTEIKEKRWKT